MGKLASLENKITTIDIRHGSSAAKRITGRELQRTNRRILIRDGYTCQMCGHVSIKLEVDHVVPLHMGGFEADSNRQALCRACHEVKSEAERAGRDG